MKNSDAQSAAAALRITTGLTILVAGYEIFSSCQSFQEGMNLPDIASYANADIIIYCMVLIIANLAFLPHAILLYRRNGISLKEKIFRKEDLGKDIFLGIILAVLSSVIGLLPMFSYKNRTELAFPGWGTLPLGTVLLMVAALVFVSGICKEIYFRGFADSFCSSFLGEKTAFILFNVSFGLLDWFNLGYSFVVGLFWIWGYRKSKHLIVPMIAHGGANLISILFYILT